MAGLKLPSPMHISARKAADISLLDNQARKPRLHVIPFGRKTGTKDLANSRDDYPTTTSPARAYDHPLSAMSTNKNAN
jgi:hypothetical protein